MMPLKIVVCAAGAMGAGIGARLVSRGAEVRTSLKGRGPGSAERAKQAGMIAVEDDRALLDGADFVLSVVPPGVALAFAERIKPVLAALPKKPVFADCNAVAPETMKDLAARLAPAGAPVVDGGIIGPPPRAEGAGPRLYVSGEAAPTLLSLRDFGLDVRLVEGGIGAASALKMCYALLGKGTTALGTAMILAAARAGVTDDLLKELGASRPDLLGYLKRTVPDMLPKAYRWVAEMEEIGKFLESPGAGSVTFEGIARLYERIASSLETKEQDPVFLKDFVDRA
jgi:3-hydroxyisobutyrate dehydrogenase-like beta-hydroxyacid dehydrogenase